MEKYKNKKTYIITAMLLILLFIIGVPNKKETKIKESPQYRDNNLKINKILNIESNIDFPISLRDFLIAVDGRPKNTIIELSPHGSLVFLTDLPGNKRVELLVQNRTGEKIDILDSQLGAIYIRDFNGFENIDKLIEQNSEIKKEDLNKYDLIKISNSNDLSLEVRLNKKENKIDYAVLIDKTGIDIKKRPE